MRYIFFFLIGLPTRHPLQTIVENARLVHDAWWQALVVFFNRGRGGVSGRAIA
jgi:hypothetical protein